MQIQDCRDSRMETNMKKTIRFAGSVLLIAVLSVACFAGCSGKEGNTEKDAVTGEDSNKENQSGKYHQNALNSSVHNYKMVAEGQDEYLIPTLTLNEEEHTFSFAYDVLSSYMPCGTYQMTDKLLTATTEDGLYQYLFEVVDNHTLKFIQEGSSEVYLFDDHLGVPIEDGSLFEMKY